MRTHDIVINRQDLREAWFADPFVAHLFTYLMVMAAHCGFRFDGVDVETGTFLSSFKTIAAETGMSVARVRRCLETLSLMGEVTAVRHKNLAMITVERIAAAARSWEAAARGDSPADTSAGTPASAPAPAENKERYSKSVYTDGYEAAAKDPVTLARSENGVPCYFSCTPAPSPRLSRQQRRRAAREQSKAASRPSHQV